MAQEVFELALEPLKTHHVSVFVVSDDDTVRQTVMKLAEDVGFVADSGTLRNARLLEGLGDFIRFLMIAQRQGSYATISVNVLPTAEFQRLGSRQVSNLY